MTVNIKKESIEELSIHLREATSEVSISNTVFEVAGTYLISRETWQLLLDYIAADKTASQPTFIIEETHNG